MTDSVLTYRDCYDQCKSLALEIIEEHKGECNEIEDFMDKTWEWVDQHEWVIYYYRAISFSRLFMASYGQKPKIRFRPQAQRQSLTTIRPVSPH